jgi:hypothetical protein
MAILSVIEEAEVPMSAVLSKETAGAFSRMGYLKNGGRRQIS